jgi:hypothetical protein
MHKLQPIVDTVLKQRLLKTRRSPEDRTKNKTVAELQMVRQYIKDGSKGGLELTHTKLTHLPDDLVYVGGTLNLQGSDIESLPIGLTQINGSLGLSKTHITELPSGLSILNHLFLTGNESFESLPDDLEVGGSIYLGGTSLKSLPDDIKIKFDKILVIINTPLSDNYTLKQIKTMYPGIKGTVHV